MTETLKQRIHKAVINPRLQENYRRATASALVKNRIRFETPALFEDLRQQAHDIRAHVVDNLHEYIDQAEAAMKRNGMAVYRAATDEDARRIIHDILKERNIRDIVKAKSMLTEEIELNPYLEARDIFISETDLGEYIIQLAGEKPSHITAPAIHKSAAEIGALFEEKLGIPYTEDEHLLTEAARNTLRERFLEAGAGLSGGNFILADSGSLVLVENEGNIRLSVTLPRIHIAVVGMEKLLPDRDSLALMMELLSYSATGQKFPGYMNLIRRPEKGKEIHVILVDNGRSRLHEDAEMRVLLHCIRCGACLNSCPVYQHVGGHSYGWAYPGPIGALLTPLMRGRPEDDELPFMSTLCGQCSAACPVKIPLHHLLLRLRHRRKKNLLLWNAGMKLFKWGATSPTVYRGAMKIVRILQVLLPGEGLPLPVWSRTKYFPKFAKKTDPGRRADA